MDGSEIRQARTSERSAAQKKVIYKLELELVSVAEFGSNEDHKNTHGYCVKLGNDAMQLACCKHTIVTGKSAFVVDDMLRLPEVHLLFKSLGCNDCNKLRKEAKVGQKVSSVKDRVVCRIESRIL